jgi:hypothetical protein
MGAVGVAAIKVVTSADGINIEVGIAAESVDASCVASNVADACSLYCWPLVRVTKEVGVGADMELEPRDVDEDHCEELNGYSASSTVCETAGILVDSGPTSSKNDGTATASKFGLAWFFPGSGLASAIPCIKGVTEGSADIVGDNVMVVPFRISKSGLPL